MSLGCKLSPWDDVGAEPGAASEGSVITVPGESKTKVSTVRRVDTAFDGLLPDSANYFYATGEVRVEALGPGDVGTVFSQKVPNNSVWDITGIEFGVIYRAIGGQYYDFPEDGIRRDAVFNFLLNENVPIEFQTSRGADGVVTGSDIIWKNVLGMWGSTPVHIVAGSGTLVTVTFAPLVVAWAPVVSPRIMALVRITGRQVQQDKWEEVSI
jgi:hypothetical protein